MRRGAASYAFRRNFALTLELELRHRGYDNQLEQRKTELRKVATSRIVAMEKKAVLEIESQILDAQTQIATSCGLSAAAQSFIAQLPTVDTLMPGLSYWRCPVKLTAHSRTVN